MKLLRLNNPVPVDLLLVATRLSSATGAFELAALGADEGLDVRAGCSSGAEVSAGQTVGAFALEHQGILAGGCTESQLIQSQDFTSCKRFKEQMVKIYHNCKRLDVRRD